MFLAELDWKTALVSVVVFFIIWIAFHSRAVTDSLVPGPYGWSVFRLTPTFLRLSWNGLTFPEILIHLSKQFGPMYSLGFGRQRLLILNGFEELKEAWHHPDLNDRAPNTMRDFLFRGKGKTDVSHNDCVFGIGWMGG